MSQVWLFGARMGPLNDALVHIGFNNPELFRVMLNERGPSRRPRSRASRARSTFRRSTESVNPGRRAALPRRLSDPRLGHDRDRLAGTRPRALYRRRSDAAARGRADGQGRPAALRDAARPEKSRSNPATTPITSWHYQRTYQYGSPSLKADGTPGVDRLTPSSAYLSKDGRSVFIGLPGIKPVMQMQRRMDTHHRRRHGVPGQRGLHALRALDVRPARGGIRRT